MVAVFSVWMSLRTKTCASAEKTAPTRTRIAPNVSAVPIAPDCSAESRGDRMMRTPAMPSPTVVMRNARTGSPRNIAAKMTVRSGAA